MWELIRANQRKSLYLFLGMGFCLLVLGYGIGAAFAPPDGGIMGIVICLGLWACLSLIAFFAGDQILLGVSHAREVSSDIHPQLFNIVEEMKIAANLPTIPKIYIIDELAPNAFATGRKPERSAVAVTTGLLSKLNRDELQGVIGHEMSHILNRDVLFMTFAGMLLGSIVLISDIFLRGGRFAGGSSRRFRAGSARVGGQAQAVFILVALLLAILAPILARFFYFALSRKREYLADASGARLTRYPEGLASALDKISSSTAPLFSANRVTAPMYIVNPLEGGVLSASRFFSTHPPIEERIKILRNLTHGVNFVNYQNAFSQVTGKKSGLVPASGLRDTSEIPIRKGTVEEPKKEGVKEGARNLGDLTRALHQYAFLICSCGLKIKIPPNFKQPKVVCPRCWRSIEIPVAQLQGVALAAGAVQSGERAGARTSATVALQVYVRKGGGWESFACACGKLQQISPKFAGAFIQCRHCNRKIEIKNPSVLSSSV